MGLSLAYYFVQGVIRVKKASQLGLLLACMLLLIGCETAQTPPMISEGVLDLQSWSFEQNGPIPLNGEWEVSPHTLVRQSTPDVTNTKFASVPSTWGDEVSSNGHGFATYSLRVLLPQNQPQLAVRLMSMSSTYALYANGQLISQGGQPGTSKADSRPGYAPGIVILPASLTGEMLLNLQVSNFHYFKGGPWEPVWLGSFDSLQSGREAWLWLSAAMTGAFFIIGLYHFLMWMIRRRDKSSLLFAITTLAMGVRVLTVDEIFLVLLWENLPWNWLVKIEYASMSIALGTIILFVHTLFPRAYPRIAANAIAAVAFAFTAFVLVTPVDVFSRALFVIQADLVVASIISPICIGLALRQRAEGSLLFLVGALAIGFASIHDIVATNNKDVTLFTIMGARVYLQPFGMLVCLLSQASLLAFRSSRTLRNLEQTSTQLQVAKDSLDNYAKELERKVALRTTELEKANGLLETLANTDELTQLWNRRHFDQELERFWSDHVRRNVSLSLLLLDIDHFKKFNDFYGHQSGDEALQAVCKIITASLSRPLDFAARYGGEEIVVILPDTTADGGHEVATKICRAVSDASIEHQASKLEHLTVSIGVAACVPSLHMSSRHLVGAADAALYRAKQQGRNRVELGEIKPPGKSPVRTRMPRVEETSD